MFFSILFSYVSFLKQKRLKDHPSFRMYYPFWEIRADQLNKKFRIETVLVRITILLREKYLLQLSIFLFMSYVPWIGDAVPLYRPGIKITDPLQS